MIYADEYIVKKEELTAIADAIRDKTLDTNVITTAEMPSKINEVYEAGKQAEYDAFWEDFQQSGNRTDYAYAFYGSGAKEFWGDRFAPKYDMQPTNATSMFQYSHASNINLKEGLSKHGVKFDLSKCTSAGSCFNYSALGDLPELDLRALSKIPLMFYSCSSKVIDKIILKSDGSQTFENPFNSCTSLEEVRFEGVIGQNGLNFKSATKLSADSIESIINALSATTSGLSITLSKTAVDAACKEMEGDGWDSTNSMWFPWLTGTKPNWTISLA